MYPVFVEDREVADARLALGGRERGDVLPPKLGYYCREVRADARGFGCGDVDREAGGQQSDRERGDD
jgi:hypothetical protein